MPHWQDEQYVRGIVKDFYAQKAPKHYLVRLPCHQVNIEIPEGHEGYMKCPEPGCGKQYMITNNMINKRLYAEDNYEQPRTRKYSGGPGSPITNQP